MGILIMFFCLSLIVTFVANSLFTKKVESEVEALFANHKQQEKGLVSKAELVGLPSPVQKWLEYSQLVGKERISTVRLKQVGSLRMKIEQPWMAEEAEQYFTTVEPGFIWKAKIKPARVLFIAGRDRYSNGQGNMLIRLLSLITVANGSGPEIDQGTMLRYLAETVWFPSAALSDYITWEAINETSARASMSYGGVTASGVFTFNEKGEAVNFTAKRYMDNNGKYSLETWSVSMRDYKVFEGIKIPTKGELTWKLQSGDFTWFNWEITDIEYNKPIAY
ncbi:DUF6544 family protein [Desulfosporosinus sp. Sb-LF]|uniref:DUF6544 family protein n=1 Tax=Desulfosporosinus sp. Sb-LF TaxID=2560027 RepID=UPI001FB0D83B|nr:DUF6544 family protein [Desulfosporosinus sp. Sb-LF]